MSNTANYVGLIKQCFLADDTLNGMVNGKIIAGFQRTSADDHLKEANHACIGIRTLSLIGQDLAGSAYHLISLYDQLFEVSVTQIADNDTYISSIVAEILRIMKQPLMKTIGGISYSVSTTGRINFVPVNDPDFSDRVETTGTFRLKYLDT